MPRMADVEVALHSRGGRVADGAITYLDRALHKQEVDLERLLPRDGSLPLETFEPRYHSAGHKVNDALVKARRIAPAAELGTSVSAGGPEQHRSFGPATETA